MAGHARHARALFQQAAQAIVRAGNGNGRAARVSKHAAESPTARHCTDQLARRKLRQFVAVRRHEHQGLRSARDVLLIRPVEYVVDTRQRILLPLPGERRGQRQAVRVALGDLSLQRVIPGVPQRRIRWAEIAELRKRAQRLFERLTYRKGCVGQLEAARHNTGAGDGAAQQSTVRGTVDVQTVFDQHRRRDVVIRGQSAVVQPCAAATDISGFDNQVWR